MSVHSIVASLSAHSVTSAAPEKHVVAPMTAQGINVLGALQSVAARRANLIAVVGPRALDWKAAKKQGRYYRCRSR